MNKTSKPRRSLWMFGLESEEPSDEERTLFAKKLSQRIGKAVEVPPKPDINSLQLRPPRIKPPDGLAHIFSIDNYERCLHSHNNKMMAFQGQFPNPPDLVAHPTNEEELENVLDWTSKNRYVTIPYGGGSSSVEGFTPPEGCEAAVTIDMDQFDQVLEIDEISRAARIQAGTYGPHLEAQLKPKGFTLRHFPQSFTGSTLGGWIATRSGGHYATNTTHIDDFVESVRMITPAGWWESRRLPGSGAGPSPDRMVIGSEGILGVITEAWMRIQVRPTYRATAGVRFPSWKAGYDATRQIVQAKLWPANLRLLDPALCEEVAGMDGNQALLVIGFESADLPQEWFMQSAIDIARDTGGTIEDSEILYSGKGEYTGRSGAVGAWRNAFITTGGDPSSGLGLVHDTVETSITWERWPEFDHMVRRALQQALDEVCGGGTLNCRFTHVYVDGPAPYYTFTGTQPGLNNEHAHQVKVAASEAIIKGGGTITHHHAVGRLHRPWYDVQRPNLFAQALKAVKKSVDPSGVMNPGVLIDP